MILKKFKELFSPMFASSTVCESLNDIGFVAFGLALAPNNVRKM